MKSSGVLQILKSVKLLLFVLLRGYQRKYIKFVYVLCPSDGAAHRVTVAMHGLLFTKGTFTSFSFSG